MKLLLPYWLLPITKNLHLHTTGSYCQAKLFWSCLTSAMWFQSLMLTLHQISRHFFYFKKMNQHSVSPFHVRLLVSFFTLKFHCIEDEFVFSTVELWKLACFVFKLARKNSVAWKVTEIDAPWRVCVLLFTHRPEESRNHEQKWGVLITCLCRFGEFWKELQKSWVEMFASAESDQ